VKLGGLNATGIARQRAFYSFIIGSRPLVMAPIIAAIYPWIN
jgi:hypothetical protein